HVLGQDLEREQRHRGGAGRAGHHPTRRIRDAHRVRPRPGGGHLRGVPVSNPDRDPGTITDGQVLSARLKANDLGWFGRFDAPTEEWRQVLTAARAEVGLTENTTEKEN